tara:strand:- start:769 stop:1518 length:750 start_codon:yes stop_codon:yes gene_type:complete
MFSIINIPQLKDNYCYLIIDNNDVIIIDPAESKLLLQYIINKNLSIKAILLTHHHADHTAGVENIINYKKVPVYSPNKKIKYSNQIVKNDDVINLNFIDFKVIETPGHTIDHIIFYNKKNKILFSGDTLFRLGCGRVFEGTYKQMYESLEKICSLDNQTNVYCGHEYTKSNLDFLLSVFPNNKKLLIENKKIDSQILKSQSSIPFNLGNEKAINPFLNAKSSNFSEIKEKQKLSNFQLFSYLRDLKNSF